MRGDSSRDAIITITPSSDTNTAIESIEFNINGDNGQYLQIGESTISEEKNPTVVTYTPESPATSKVEIHNNKKNIIITQITVKYTTNGTSGSSVITPVIRVEKEFVSLNINSSETQNITVWSNDEQITDITSFNITSSNPEIATAVYNNGTITITSGNKEGTTTITLASDAVESKYNSANTDIYVTVGDVIPTVTFSSSPEQGAEGEDYIFDENQIKVTLSVAGDPNLENYDIYYTLNGTTPKKDKKDPDKNKYVNPIDLAATTFVNAVAYKKDSDKHGEVVQHVFRFNFTLVKALTNGQEITPGYESIIYKDEEKKTVPYIITTLGSKGDISNLWSEAKERSNMLGSEISGYKYTSLGKTDARGEDARQYNGQVTDATNGCTGDRYEEESYKNATFSIPINGAYMKFEPKMDGQVNAIVRQNGIIAALKDTYTDNDLRKMSIRKVYVCDETGTVIRPEALINSNSMMNQDIFLFNENKFTEDIDNSKANLAYYQELLFNALDDNKKSELRSKENAWKEGVHIHNILAEKDNGWLTVSRSYVRYSFDVKAGKTYFLMGNGTKIGPCGYSFKRKLKDDAFNDFMSGRDIPWDESAPSLPTPISNTDDKEGFVGSAGPCNITLKRQFDKGAWTSLVLPFSVSPSGVKEAFGEGTEIIHFNTIDGARIHLTKHFHQMIVAGTPVLIKPGKNISKKEGVKFSNVTYMSYYEDKDNSGFKPAPIKEMTGGGWKITGSYTPATVPADSYLMGYKKETDNSFKSSLYLLKEGMSINGTRAWFERIDDSAAAKLTGLYFDGVEDNEVTAIEEVLADMNVTDNRDNAVYNMNGQKVCYGKHGLSGMAKGIYIMNGKKFIVK